MPKAAAKKIRSALSPQIVTLVVSLVLLILGFLSTPTARLSANGHIYGLQIVETMAAQEKGLGGRASLPASYGMLFVFKSEAARCFWMKGMRFPLDIIWLNSSKKVVAIKQNVSPATYPTIFCPKVPARYVIELNAGQAAVSGTVPGQALQF